jgi:type I restriction-modification system DNA methylase subunit
LEAGQVTTHFSYRGVIILFLFYKQASVCFATQAYPVYAIFGRIYITKELLTYSTVSSSPLRGTLLILFLTAQYLMYHSSPPCNLLTPTLTTNG